MKTSTGLAGMGLAVAAGVLGRSLTHAGEPATAVRASAGHATATSRTSTTGSTGARPAGPTRPSPSPAARRRVAAVQASTRTVNGEQIDTMWGPVQVRLTLRGSTITDVSALEVPSSQSRSLDISGYSVPLLRQEVLAAQSANIQGVSGASYTSDGYARSVQSALDKA
jgi:uncharacterized protein with FMN-binding domain